MMKCFYNCSSLNSLHDISKWKINENISINKIFHNCLSLAYLSDINKKDILSINNNCISLLNP